MKVRNENDVNFEVKQALSVDVDGEKALIVTVITAKGELSEVELHPHDFDSPLYLRKAFSRHGFDLTFRGGEKGVATFKASLLSQSKEVRGVKATGIYEHEGRYVYVSADGNLPPESRNSIIQISKRTFGLCSRILECAALPKEKMKLLGYEAVGYNVLTVTVPILLWCSACFLRGQLRANSIRFPPLLLMGEAGSGKTETLKKLILPLFSMESAVSAALSDGTAILQMASSSNLFPLVIDGFRPGFISHANEEAVNNLLLTSYDGTGVRDFRQTQYFPLAPLVVAGGESVCSRVIRERCVEVHFEQDSLKNTNCEMMYSMLPNSAEKLKALGRLLLDISLDTSSETVLTWYREGVAQFRSDAPSFAKNNYACCFAGYMLLHSAVSKSGLDWNQVFPCAEDECLQALNKSFGNIREIYDENEVERILIKMSDISKTSNILYTVAKGNLYLNLTSAYDAFVQYCRENNAVYPLRGNLARILDRREYCIGRNIQKIIDGKNCKCCCLDYELLKKRCGKEIFNETAEGQAAKAKRYQTILS